MKNNKKWIVITSGDRSMDEISAELKQQGFYVEYVLDAIGQITGEGGSDMEEKAMKIKGVVSVIPAQDDIQIGDPDSAITW